MDRVPRKRKNMAVRLIRKQVRGFRQGEWIFFDSFYDDKGPIHGSYYIREIKKHTEATRTFLCEGVRGASTRDWIVVEFLSATELYRIAGEPVAIIIHEEEFA